MPHSACSSGEKNKKKRKNEGKKAETWKTAMDDMKKKGTKKKRGKKGKRKNEKKKGKPG